MFEENDSLNVLKEITPEIYQDVGQPVAKPTGELLGLVPRAIKAALEPIEKWIMQKEYNIAETKKLLELKLEKVSPELIEAPEPYIAVPAVQYISYCMDNEELRNMYANLLANSMNKVVKDGVHPGFVEIIKQLSPDEAKFLKYMGEYKRIPIITLNLMTDNNGKIPHVKDFSNVPEIVKCESLYDSEKYVDNLVRLGLMRRSTLSTLTDKTLYEPLKNHPYIIAKQKEAELIIEMTKGITSPFTKTGIDEGYVDLTAFGETFYEICIKNP